MELRPYQEEDVAFLTKYKRMACFNEQRTGKTPTALTVMKQHKKILVICPASAIYPWAEEFEAWLNRPCLAVAGTRCQKETIVEQWTDGLICSYGSFKNTIRMDGLSDQILRANPDAIILDEAHRIKDPKSQNALAIFRTQQIPHRLALTGTPAPGKPHEVYSILHWLYPEKYTSYWKFIDTYFEKTIEKSSMGKKFITINSFKKGMDKRLQLVLSQMSTQRKRKEVMPWLPDKDYQRIKLPVTTAQKRYLYELSKFFETEQVVTQGVLDRLIRYRQICLHPKLLNLPGTSPKLDWILSYVSDYPQTPTIIFSKFTSFIKILMEELPSQKFGVIIGDTPLKTRNALVQKFQKGDIKLLLINIDAGKEALTLDTAEAIIFTDKYPPIGDIQQAEDRFIATTELKANKPHTIIELMMKGTYDEELYKLLTQRKSETDVINDYKKYERSLI